MLDKICGFLVYSAICDENVLKITHFFDNPVILRKMQKC